MVVAARQAPFYLPDEGAHYLRAYEVSQLHLINLPNAVGVHMPCKEYTVVATKYYPIAFFQTKSAAEQAVAFCQVRTTNTAGGYSFVPYIPAALALAFTDELNWTVESKLVAARIANFSVWFSVLFLSLIWLKQGRILIACLMLIPSFFWQLVALSADGATLTSCLLYIIFVVRIAERKLAVTRGMLTILIALGVFIGAAKGVYSPIALLSFGLWGNLPGRNWFYKFCVLSCPVLAALGIFLAQSAFSDSRLIYLGNNANPALQLAFVMQNPLLFMTSMFKSTVNMDIVSLVAPTYAVPNPTLGLWIGFVTFATFAILSICSGFGIEKRIRLVSGFLVAIGLVGISLPLYLTYSPVQFDTILGLQGRYYLPMLPLIFIALAFKATPVPLANFFHIVQRRMHWAIYVSMIGLMLAVGNIP